MYGRIEKRYLLKSVKNTIEFYYPSLPTPIGNFYFVNKTKEAKVRLGFRDFLPWVPLLTRLLVSEMVCGF